MFNSLKFLKNYKNQPALEYLRKLEKKKIPIRLEVDSSNVCFYTLLMLRSGQVVLAKPPGSVRGISKGASVRFRIPYDHSKEILLSVTNPNFTLFGGDSVFLCRIPDGNPEPTRRSSERFNTAKFSNLYLFISKFQQPFRVIDISFSGCQVLSEGVDKSDLLGFTSNKIPAKISVGGKFLIEYGAVIPRFYSPSKIGFQLFLANNPSAKERLTRLLDSLHQNELSRLKLNK